MIVNQGKLRLDFNSSRVPPWFVYQSLLLGLCQSRRRTNDRLIKRKAGLFLQLYIFDKVGISGEIDYSFEVIGRKEIFSLGNDFNEWFEGHMGQVLDIELAAVGEKAF